MQTEEKGAAPNAAAKPRFKLKPLEGGASATAEIARTLHMNVVELLRKYKDLYGRDAATRSPVALRRLIAWRLQEIRFGGFTPEDERKLHEIALSDPPAMMRKDAQPNFPPRGTRIEKTWKGRTYVVEALGDGTWNFSGCVYKTLSGVALAITGVRWSGRQFFGKAAVGDA